MNPLKETLRILTEETEDKLKRENAHTLDRTLNANHQPHQYHDMLVDLETY